MTTSTAERQTGWTADASTFGARLALIRQKMGWGNVDKAARECGVAVETWRSWERDNREPHRLTTVAKQISGVVGVDYLWLVHGPDRGQGGTDSHLLAPMSPRLVATIGGPRTGEPTRGVTRTRPLRTRTRAAIAAAA